LCYLLGVSKLTVKDDNSTIRFTVVSVHSSSLLGTRLRYDITGTCTMRYIRDFPISRPNTSFGVLPISSWEEVSVLKTFYLCTGCSYVLRLMAVQECSKSYKEDVTAEFECD